MKRTLLASAVSLVFGLAAAQQAVAAPAPQTFCVNSSAYIDAPDLAGHALLEASVARCTGTGSTSALDGFVVNNVTGAYAERLIVTQPGGPATPLFFGSTTVVDLNKLQFGSFALDDTVPGAKTGLDTSYNLYAVVNATGTISGTTFTATAATVNVFLDPNRNTVVGDSPFTPLVNDVFGAFPNLAFLGAGAGEDVNLGSANLLQFASGTLGSTQANDGFAVQFGNFAPTAAGTNFFIRPNPFYVVLFSDGDISNGFTVTAPAQLDLSGEANVIFAVPEPTSVALVGLAMLGLGFAGRRTAKRG